MLDIDNKIYRNIQEQVAHNTSTIAEIIRVTDAEELANYIDQFSTWSDTMADYANTMNGYATTMGNYATTMNNYANTMNGYANTMAGYASQVDTWANNIAGSALAVINANNVTPLTVEQQNANWKKTGDFALTAYSAGLTLTNIYNACEVINGVLYLIMNVKLENNSGADITITANKQILQRDIYAMPNNFANNVIDFLGHSVKQNSGDGVVDFTMIAQTVARCFNDPSSLNPSHYDNFYLSYRNRVSGNNSCMFLQNSQSVTFPNGSTRYLTARMSLTLL